ncbi:hypothetical protein R6G85_06755 [Actinotignum urinale]|uniref:Uncharacterized protein n=1 Tax=Actinotignum urinale TaxID=190146 RepID=A0ABU5G8K0_9ACTO|nr:hypothetical protein [Actinotignum urinale]MDY5133642.1 hypothetical protein [Actinotignum urinale]MDY5152173.1 hypothetical protein [Actinotignum urinale]MDY5159508.1 hypothetical protein [Actinotignum urinale]
MEYVELFQRMLRFIENNPHIPASQGRTLRELWENDGANMTVAVDIITGFHQKLPSDLMDDFISLRSEIDTEDYEYMLESQKALMQA